MFRMTVKTPLKRKQKKCAKRCFVGNGLHGCLLGHFFSHPSTKQKKAVSWSVCLKTVSKSWRFLFPPKAWWEWRTCRFVLMATYVDICETFESNWLDICFISTGSFSPFLRHKQAFHVAMRCVLLCPTAVLVHSISQNLVLPPKGSAFEEGLRPTESEWPVWSSNNKDSSKWKGYGKTWKTKKFDVWLSFKVSLPFLTCSTFAAGLKHLKNCCKCAQGLGKMEMMPGTARYCASAGNLINQPLICYRLENPGVRKGSEVIFQHFIAKILFVWLIGGEECGGFTSKRWLMRLP